MVRMVRMVRSLADRTFQPRPRRRTLCTDRRAAAIETTALLRLASPKVISGKGLLLSCGLLRLVVIWTSFGSAALLGASQKWLSAEC